MISPQEKKSEKAKVDNIFILMQAAAASYAICNLIVSCFPAFKPFIFF